MKAILINLSLLFFVSLANAQAANCKISIQGGGVDTWPWMVAQPFPWNNIQGIWKLSTDNSTTYFKMRVISSNSKRKVLNISKIEGGNCGSPIATGVGFVTTDERNVVRAIMTDKRLRYQLKLAMFDTKDLSESSLLSCGDEVLAASMQVIGQKNKISTPIDVSTYEVENMVLKKISTSLDSICKKPTSR